MPWAEKLITSKSNDTQAPEEGRVLSYMEALHEALSLALELDPKVLILGQGVNDPKGMFGVTTGLHEKFGKDRVFDTPLSEEGMTGICTGASMNGLRPVYMHNRPDFLLLAFNQIVGHASKIHYMDNGETNVPLVIWSAIGRGWGSGSQHSQAIQGLLLGVPGLKIVMPSTPHDAKGLMLSAIADNNPVLIFEHRWSMRNKGVVPEGAYKISLGKGIYRRKGNDLTIVGTSHILELAIKAADELEGITADVIDLRTIKPLDEKIIIDSLQKTGRILIVDTGWEMGGVCAEIGCMVAEKGFSFLKGPVRRLGLSDIPSPAGFTLEQYYYPDVKKITHVIKDMVAST
ncbi:MAG: alpha-ketoacid dehydrogenase subunit beta [Rickettsiales bacterium]|jgi:pyruvate dehydrogenase E1 component beta subunit|uniref:Transketolase-like pyrimidine-binding domain-containing protein n=1 Tax=marine metagenome TaxID=408172 RepID=A0A381SRZ3_9ZZZZ|nr:alpha-ketoacid dehydrogenase subunit beta [Rickettsiales bacterium]HAT22003.1 alpha-ketoacid dehydrogenase subunit beta [Dehalococcoidia bacterium]HIO23393.1 alpha-ketoacid dehydrogenase subunit beta [Nitrospinaceae bacterium]|tara:strand:+ start:148 stop:1182 length:1035 start_codon:yes stop_codon:yes gene_type:complete